ncbi:SIR2 family protein [Cupriavidus sp. 8B]
MSVHKLTKALETGRLRIYKMNGSISDPKSLCLTTADLRAIESRPVFQTLRALMTSSRVAVVGHSLRDGNMAELMEDRNRNDGSVYVSPALVDVDDITLARFNLLGVRKDADEFLESFDPARN